MITPIGQLLAEVSLKYELTNESWINKKEIYVKISNKKPPYTWRFLNLLDTNVVSEIVNIMLNTVII